jgi:mannose/cellobiose epimerase-like protein (N-acyl-D-glucosamine 2-epimerase family)
LRAWQPLSVLPVGDRVGRLSAHAMAYGIDRERGLVRNIVRKNESIVNDAARFWPQTETIRVLCREASSGKAWPNLFSEITERLFRAHQSADLNGGRIDQVDGNGTDRVDYMPANTLCVSKAVWMVPAWSRSRRHERRPTGTSIPIETVYSGGLQ